MKTLINTGRCASSPLRGAARRLAQLTLFGVLASSCIYVPVRHGPGYHGAAAVRRECPPSYHWDGYGCVHNGNGHAYGKR